MRFKKFFELIKNCNGDKFSGGTFFEITDVFFFSFLNRHHHTTANAPTPTLTQPTTQRRQHILTHTDTCSHILTQPNTTKHITHFQHRYRPTSFQVAQVLLRGKTREKRAEKERREKREERREKREERREKRKEKREKRKEKREKRKEKREKRKEKREKRREREREREERRRERRTDRKKRESKNDREDSRRLRVYPENARMFNTCTPTDMPTSLWTHNCPASQHAAEFCNVTVFGHLCWLLHKLENVLITAVCCRRSCVLCRHAADWTTSPRRSQRLRKFVTF